MIASLFAFAALVHNLSIPHATVGIYAVLADTGEVVIDQNSDLSLVPCSCLKIATTAAALQILGPEFRFETDLEYDGEIDQDKVLRGNLYIRGGGDPTLGSDRLGSWEKQIEIWRGAIAGLGIEKIEGKVIGDATRWEKALAPASWLWEDLGNYYGAGASALSFHENNYRLVFRPGAAVGEPAAILRTDPPLPDLLIQNEVKTGPVGSGDQACIYGSEYTSCQFVRGTIPAAVLEFTIRGAIPNPARTAVDLLTGSLKIPIENKELPQNKEHKVFHTTLSPFLREIVHWTNQESVNLYAEHLVKAIGWAVYREGSTGAGIKAILEFWKTQGIDLSGAHLVDGSGLSRKNLLTPKQLVQILLKMKKSPPFFDSLPEVHEGVRAKSGSMSLNKAYAGYAGNLVFAVIVNHAIDPKVMKEKFLLLFSQLNKQKDKS